MMTLTVDPISQGRLETTAHLALVKHKVRILTELLSFCRILLRERETCLFATPRVGLRPYKVRNTKYRINQTGI